MKEHSLVLDNAFVAPAADTMQAYQLTAPKLVEKVNTKIPEPGPDEVLIKLEGCGLCVSSLPVWEGRPWFDYPREPGSPGHEGYGVIDQVGNRVTDFNVGDRVTGLTYHSFAGFDVAKEEQLVKIPDTLKYMPLPGEPLGCAMNIFRRSGIKEGQHVAIIGIGFLGALLIQLAKKAGATVYAISRRPYSLEVAQQMKADGIFSLEEMEKAAGAIRDLTSGKGCDCVVEATGKQAPLDFATDIVATRGKIVVAGYHQDGLRKIDMQVWNWKGIDVINAHERAPEIYVQGIKEAITAIEECTLDVTPLFTHYFTPDRIQEAFEVLATRPEGFVKGILLFD